MNTTIICIIIVGLLFLTFACHTLFRYIKQTESTVKHEITKNLSIIAATQELQRFTTYLPYKSYALGHCLNNRLVEAAQAIIDVDSENPIALDALQEANTVMQNLKIIRESAGNEDNLSNWKFSGGDKKALAFLKFIKRLKTTLKTEHSKGNIDTAQFQDELDRLDGLRTKINIENAKKMAQQAAKQSDYAGAAQILRKGIAYAENRIDQYAINPLTELKQMLDEVTTSQRRKEQQFEETHGPDNMTQREREISQLFDKSKSYW